MIKDDLRYAYAVGRIRVLETKLLNKNTLLRILKGQDLQTTFTILSETEYARSFPNIEDFYNLEDGLNKELERTYDLVRKISPEPELIDLFLIKYDFHNIKVFLKASSAELPLIPLGLVDLKLLERAIKEKDYKEIPFAYQEAINKVRDRQEVDIILDNELYALLYEKAIKYKNGFLKKLFQIQIDLFNIDIFLRVKRFRKDKKFLDKVLLEKGKLEKKFFLDSFEEEIEVFKNKLFYTNYAHIINGDRNAQISSYILSYVKQGKYTAFGLSSLVGYLMAKENEVKLLRFIILGKLNRLSQQLVEEKLWDVYV